MTKSIVKGLVVSLFFSTGLKASAQDLQTVYGAYIGAVVATVTIPAGKVLEIVSGYGYFQLSNTPHSSFSVSAMPSPVLLVGPNTLSTKDDCFITYRLKDNISTTTTIPTSAVVIPTDATGPVNVILESSTDLVTWTQANPGTYGASTTTRFFRVRAVNQ